MTPALSYAIACMDRLPHLRENLETSLPFFRHLPAEVVVVDYGSKRDDIPGWIRERRAAEPELYRNVRVFRTDSPRVWFHSHAKNVAHSATNPQARVICNVDSDTFIGPGLTEFLLQTIWPNKKLVVAAPDTQFIGTIAMPRASFFELGGYNEDLRFGYGYEDTDLLSRAVGSGLTRVELPFRSRIEHGPTETTANHPQKRWVVSAGHNLKRMMERKGNVANQGRRWGVANLVEI